MRFDFSKNIDFWARESDFTIFRKSAIVAPEMGEIEKLKFGVKEHKKCYLFLHTNYFYEPPPIRNRSSKLWSKIRKVAHN